MNFNFTFRNFLEHSVLISLRTLGIVFVVYVMGSIGLVLHLKLFGLHKSHVVMITSTSDWKNKTKNVFPQVQVLRGNFRKMILFKKRIPGNEKPTSKFYRMRKIST